MRFQDRSDAGRRVAAALAGTPFVDPVVLALPRGGVPVGAEVATAIGAPLDVFVVRKVGAPGHAELGIGAIAEGGGVVFDPTMLQTLGLSEAEFRLLADREEDELARRVATYRGDRPLPRLAGRDVVLVDDGLATGATAEAALRALSLHHPRRLILAVPVCAPETASRLRSVADEVVCIDSPPNFRAVGQSYERFDQTTDDEVLHLLGRGTSTD